MQKSTVAKILQADLSQSGGKLSFSETLEVGEIEKPGLLLKAYFEQQGYTEKGALTATGWAYVQDIKAHFFGVLRASIDGLKPAEPAKPKAKKVASSAE